LTSWTIADKTKFMKSENLGFFPGCKKPWTF